jgi:transposase
MAMGKEYVEGLCECFSADEGRPGPPPGRYFRLLLIGYFEGLDAERAIAWRAADSFALREFLGLMLPEAPPDHSTISRTRRLIDLETHQAVFTWMLQRLADTGLVKGKTVGIDATTLEANAALRSIVRRDTGESYQGFLTKLVQASGIETPTRADLARIDRKRKKKGSNDDWTHPHDPDARITKMKDARRHPRREMSAAGKECRTDVFRLCRSLCGALYQAEVAAIWPGKRRSCQI